MAAVGISLVGAAAMACSGGDDELILATTTSTQDSGLLDVLVPEFEDQYDCNVKTIAMGSGEAIRLGSEGEADVLLVHSPKAEEEFMTAGNGESRDLVMHNDFVIAGPADDPAGIAEAESAAGAMALISESEEMFLSRGDESGTHTKELGLWATAEIEPAGSWYQETGQGMGATLNVATEKQGYTLTDRGTYLAQRDNLDLDILYEGDKALNNVYHVIVVDPEKHSEVNVDCARDFATFVIAADTQATIGEFGVDEFGEPLFIPDAGTDAGTATPAP
jgi:tungstate transport system substrate-binding protein